MSGKLARAAALGCALLWSGCSLSTFTQGYRQNYAISDAEVKQIQFFTSDDIVLQRETASQSRGNVGSAYRVTSNTKLQEVVIPKGTPAVVLEVVRLSARGEPIDAPPSPSQAPGVEYLRVGFAPNDPDKALWFSTQRSKTSGRYELIHVARIEHGVPVFSPGFALHYDGEDYQLKDDDMWQVHLLFDQDFASHREVDRVSPPGWRLSTKAAVGSPPPTAAVGPRDSDPAPKR